MSLAQTHYLRDIQKMVSGAAVTPDSAATDPCPICYEDLTHDDKTSLDCTHAYHADCFLKHAQFLIQAHRTVFCPMCRKEFPPIDNDAAHTDVLPPFSPRLLRTTVTRSVLPRVLPGRIVPSRVRNLGFNGSAFTAPDGVYERVMAARRRAASVRFV